MSFDCVIPCHMKDYATLGLCVSSIEEHIKPDRIFVVSPNRGWSGSSHPELQHVPESMFPFSKDDVAERIVKKEQAGWYWQQLIQFYLWDVLDLSPDVLVVNADVVFFKDIEFRKDGRYLLNHCDNVHQPYRNHIKRLFPDIGFHGECGVTHHMLYADFMVWKMRHEIGGETWIRCLNEIDHGQVNGMAEFEMYYHYAFSRFPHLCEKRKLAFNDRGDYENWTKHKDEGLDYCAYHSYMRG